MVRLTDGQREVYLNEYGLLEVADVEQFGKYVNYCLSQQDVRDLLEFLPTLLRQGSLADPR